MATFQEAAQQAYQQAQQFLNNGGYAAEPGEDVSQIVQQFAIKNLSDQYGAEFVSNNLQQFAPYIPGLNVEAAQQQIGNLVRLGQAQSGGPFGINELQPVDQFLERTGVPLAIGIGGAYIGAGSGGLLGDAAGSGVTAADVGGGMLPEYGTTGAYNAGIGAGGTITGGTGDATLIGNAGQDVIPSSNAGVGVEGGTTGTQAASTDLGGGLSVDQYGNVTGGQFAGGPGTAGGADYAALGTDPVTGAAVAGTTSGVTGGTVGSTVGTGATAAGTGVWNRIFDGTATAGDYATIAGAIAPGLLGYEASNNQTEAFTNLANQYMAFGAPYRDQLAQLDTPDGINNYLNSAEVTTPVQQGTNALARSLSINGNPAGSGTALQEIQNYATNSLSGQLYNRRNQLANFGGLSSFNAAAPQLSAGAINSQANGYNALGYSLGSAFNPQPSLADVFRNFGHINQRGLT
jgi:hypothetical protein